MAEPETFSEEEVFGPQRGPGTFSDEEVFGQRSRQTGPDFSAANVVRGNQFAFGPAEEYEPGQVPQAFLDRISRGQALKRITDRAMSSAGEGFGNEPLGINDEHVRQLRDLGIFYNPATGRPGHVGVLGEAAIDLTANGLDTIMRSIAAGVYGAGGAFGQLVDEFGGGDTQSLKAEREAINLGNQLLIEMGMGHYARSNISRDNIIRSQPIGGLPTEADFRNAATAIAPQRLTTPVRAEEDLRRLWWERGVLPSEAVRDTAFAALAKEPVGFIVWHGSPHNFEAFDLSKIGSGEGAQVYGHGLYFAESRGIGESYQRDLGGVKLVNREGKEVTLGREDMGAAKRVVQQFDGSLDNAIEGVRRLAETSGSDFFKGDLATLERWKKEGAQPQAGGVLYRIRINADPEQFLDYDKPLNEQNEQVKSALEQMGYKPPVKDVSRPSIGDLEFSYQVDPETDEIVHPKVMDLLEKLGWRDAPEKLRAVGIPGLKYLDHDSRLEGTGTRNYVVFDDQAVQITHKNDVPVENLRELWQTRGIHPAEAAHDAGQDAFLRDEIANPGGASLGAARTPTVSGTMAGVRYEVTTDQLEQMKAARKAGAGKEQIQQMVDTFRGEQPISPAAPASAASTGVSLRDRIIDAYATSTGGKFNIRGSIADIKRILSDVPKDQLDAELLLMQREGKAALYPKDNKFELTQADREAAIHIAGNPRHILWIERDPRKPRSLGAAAIDDTPTLEQQLLPPPGSLVAALRAVQEKLFDIGRDIQMMMTPMAAGSRDAMALAKDFANAIRRNRWEWNRVDRDIANRFTPEQRKRMWDAADEESVARQLGESTEHQGLVTLDPEERVAVDDLQARAQLAWAHARDLGMVEGEGLPAYTPRMVLNVAEAGGDQRALPLNSIGRNLTTRTSQMLHREHMMAEETEAAAKEKVRAAMTAAGKSEEEIEAAVAKVGIARDIRSLPLATAKLEDAIAGRTLVNAIQDAGRATGDDTVSIGSNPGQGWFTIDHPALYQWRPKFKDGAVVKDEDGNAVFERQPIYIRSDFEGPLRAVLTKPSGATYQALMSLKGKTMGLVMYSPMIHNMVEFGRAFPAMPVRIFKAYWDGNRAKNDVGLMKEAIDNGLVPIGKRFFNQDITSIMEEPNLTPGRSWTAQVTGFIPGLFDQEAGNAVKAAIDKAGDFWHNTLLWDRIADLQMGIYVNMRGDLVRKGLDQQTASRVAAHLANRYAGALPKEAMSDAATKFANFAFFSRTFTFGNLGVLKDAFTGLPKDLYAQIERDVGAEAAQAAKSVARRKAQMTVGMDVMLAYLGYQVFQVASNVLLGDSTLDEEMHGYVRRLRDIINDAHESPWSLLTPFAVADRMSATYENEPHLKDRIRIGYMSDGTGIYARNPVGKIGEEFRGWFQAPLETLRRKEGTIAGPMLRVFMNDNGFGHHIYDPNAETPAANAGVIWDIVKYFAEAQVPVTQIGAAADLIRGEGDPKYNALSLGLPLLGVTVRKGAPGGPAIGEMYNARDAHQFAFDRAWPDIRKQIQRGDADSAREQMTELGVPPGLQRYYIRTAQDPRLRLSPKVLRDFYRSGYSTPEQQRRMDRLR